jgi:hypothetical protein
MGRRLSRSNRPDALRILFAQFRRGRFHTEAGYPFRSEAGSSEAGSSEAGTPKPEPKPVVPVPKKDTEESTETKPDNTKDDTPWYKKVWSWIAGGGIGSLGIGGSMLSGVEPITVGIIVGALLIVFCVVWFTRKGNGW